MRAMVIFSISVAVFSSGFAQAQPTPKDEKKDDTGAAKGPAKLTPAAEQTRTKALKTKVSITFTNARLGDVLKELAAQADMKADVQLMWAYGADFPFAKKVTYEGKDKTLEAILDELFKKNGELGYVIISKDGDKHDGWVLLTTSGERGIAKPEVKLTDEEETDAATKLALAKKLIDAGKADQAKTVLTFILKKYPTAKISADAKEMLSKLEK